MGARGAHRKGEPGWEARGGSANCYSWNTTGASEGQNSKRVADDKSMGVQNRPELVYEPIMSGITSTTAHGAWPAGHSLII